MDSKFIVRCLQVAAMAGIGVWGVYHLMSKLSKKEQKTIDDDSKTNDTVVAESTPVEETVQNSSKPVDLPQDEAVSSPKNEPSFWTKNLKYLGPIKLTDITGKGKGYIATEKILPGTLLLEEKIFLADCSNRVEVIERLIKKNILKDTLKQVEDLCPRAGEELSEEFVTEVNQFFEEKNIDNNEDTLRMAAVLARNVADDKMYLHSSYLNHSCKPNARLRNGFLHATKVIEEGEEVCVNYMVKDGLPLLMRADRQERFSTIYGFTCMCPLCRGNFPHLESIPCAEEGCEGECMYDPVGLMTALLNRQKETPSSGPEEKDEAQNAEKEEDREKEKEEEEAEEKVEKSEDDAEKKEEDKSEESEKKEDEKVVESEKKEDEKADESEKKEELLVCNKCGKVASNKPAQDIYEKIFRLGFRPINEPSEAWALLDELEKFVEDAKKKLDPSHLGLYHANLGIFVLCTMLAATPQRSQEDSDRVLRSLARSLHEALQISLLVLDRCDPDRIFLLGAILGMLQALPEAQRKVFPDYQRDYEDTKAIHPYLFCSACDKPSADPLKKCSRCGEAYYCNASCQRTHWAAGHKQECKVAEKERK